MSVLLTRKLLDVQLTFSRLSKFMIWLRQNGTPRQPRALFLRRGDNSVRALRGPMTSHHTTCKNIISYSFIIITIITTIIIITWSCGRNNYHCLR